MSYLVEIKEQPAQPALTIRTRTPARELPNRLGQGYEAVMRYLGEAGGHPAGAPFVAYYNMDMEDLDVEFGFPVDRELPGSGEVQSSQVPGGRQAVCLYTGPYQELALPYEAINEFLRERGEQPTGTAYEFYLNDPEVTPPQELQTLIVFPLVDR